MAVTSNSQIQLSDMVALATLANTKTTLAGTPYAFSSTAFTWLSEFNRLSENLGLLLYASHFSNSTQEISVISPMARWPLLNVVESSFSGLEQDVDFYHEDTGHQEYFSISLNLSNIPLLNESSLPYVTCTLVFGGNLGIVNSSSGIEMGTNQDFVLNPTSQSTTMSGCTNTGPNRTTLGFSFPSTITPGTYSFSFGPLLSTTTVNSFIVTLIGGPVIPTSATAGVDSTKTPMIATGPRASSGTPFGLYQPANSNALFTTYFFSTTTPGYFVGKYPIFKYLSGNFCLSPPCSIGNARGELMPWNLPLRIWQPYYTVGLGEWIVDINGKKQTCSTAGVTGALIPSWATTTGAHTTDGSAVWVTGSTAPLINRMVSCPRYPFYKDTAPSVVIPGQVPASTSGWFIYELFLNRYIVNPASQVSVTVGCIRNGSFVAFGSYLTGTSYQVFWPVFSAEPLVYQCSEAVDIQASICNMEASNIPGNGYVHGRFSYPIRADAYNWVESMLGLVS